MTRADAALAALTPALCAQDQTLPFVLPVRALICLARRRVLVRSH